jgi:hypothetical protein
MNEFTFLCKVEDKLDHGFALLTQANYDEIWPRLCTLETMRRKVESMLLADPFIRRIAAEAIMRARQP